MIHSLCCKLYSSRIEAITLLNLFDGIQFISIFCLVLTFKYVNFRRGAIFIILLKKRALFIRFLVLFFPKLQLKFLCNSFTWNRNFISRFVIRYLPVSHIQSKNIELFSKHFANIVIRFLSHLFIFKI